MLSVIVETADAGDRLPALLAALTSLAVEGLVREVLIAGGGPPELLDVLREETGAELAAGVSGGRAVGPGAGSARADPAEGRLAGDPGAARAGGRRGRPDRGRGLGAVAGEAV